MGRVWKEFSKGLWKDLPPFKLVLGLCPVLAVTTSASNGVGMGAAVIFVLGLSNLVISLARNIIPKQVRIACFIALSATLVVAVELTMQAFLPGLYASLGIFVPLIVVNCIILGRAEAFACKNPPLLALADGLGIGLGYGLSLTFLGGIRELFGAGTLFGMQIFGDSFEPFGIMIQAPGAFICLGLILAAINRFTHWQARKRGEIEMVNPSPGCSSCMGCAMGSAGSMSGVEKKSEA